MVDQLWLCLRIVERRNDEDDGWDYFSSDVLTSFPHSSYPRTSEPSTKLSTQKKVKLSSQASKLQQIYQAVDIRQSVLGKVLKEKDFDPGRKLAPNVMANLTSSIFSNILLGVLSDQTDWSLNFLELFREAIGEVAERYNEHFQRFDNSFASDVRENDIMQKRQEVRLGIQITDIIDELHMLKNLFNTQQHVLHKANVDLAKSHVSCLNSFTCELDQMREKIKTEYLLQVTRMIADSERIQRNLFDLLDLQQKEENLYEAQSANQQALFAAKQALAAQDQVDATNAQSQIIVIFTVVTIFFLPLSFFTSFYGMDILDKNSGDGTNYERSYVYKITFGVSLPIITVLLFGTWM